MDERIKGFIEAIELGLVNRNLAFATHNILVTREKLGLPPSPWNDKLRAIVAEKYGTLPKDFIEPTPAPSDKEQQPSVGTIATTLRGTEPQDPFYKVGDTFKLGARTYKVTSVDSHGLPGVTSLGAAIGDAIIDAAFADPKALRQFAKAIDVEITLLKARASELERDRGVDYHNFHEVLKRVEVLEGSYIQHNGQLLDLVPMVNKHSEKLDEQVKWNSTIFDRICNDEQNVLGIKATLDAGDNLLAVGIDKHEKRLVELEQFTTVKDMRLNTMHKRVEELEKWTDQHVRDQGALGMRVQILEKKKR